MHFPLPEEFIRLRRPMLGNEWDDFLASYDTPKSYGLRRNPLKKECRLPFTMTPVPWAEGGFYAVMEEHPGKHPLHEAGAYYIQEPSAMSVVSLLSPRPDEIICDLCAAPGGKSTQIAGMMQGNGLLISNEIISSRAKILSQNIERLGIANSIVTNHTPDQMAALFPLAFDRIAVDAPCSGEGMFRKDETAVREWSPENIAHCANRQRMILNCADRMLRPGGTLVYSTCTFAPEENEEMVAWFLSTHPDYELADWKDCLSGLQETGICSGSPDYINWERLSRLLAEEGVAPADGLRESICGTMRLWPHKLAGEGHFAARMHKKDRMNDTLPASDRTSRQHPARSLKKGKTSGEKEAARKNALKLYNAFADTYLSFHGKASSAEKEPSAPAELLFSIGRRVSPDGFHLELFGEELYALPPDTPSLSGVKVLRAGLDIGAIKKNRFEPSHALSKILSPQLVQQHKACTMDEVVRFLKGETLSCEASCKGWILVCYEDLPLGWGKAQNGIIKNHYPKGLRWNG